MLTPTFVSDLEAENAVDEGERRESLADKQGHGDHFTPLRTE